ncbi:hypothetical protein OS035_24415 [Rhizobium sp. 268]|uniref:hypothetical protein n=1 Tax=Rhizobium sp. 268 TaxID=2996375 RepID=UPI002F95FE1B
MPTLKLSDDDLELVTAALREQIRVIEHGAWPTQGFDPKKYGGQRHNTPERLAGRLRELQSRLGLSIGVVDMPDTEPDAITADEAVRRRSIAEMIIAEVQAAKAFRKSAGLDPEGSLQGGMHPPAEIAAYLGMKASDARGDEVIPRAVKLPTIAQKARLYRKMQRARQCPDPFVGM